MALLQLTEEQIRTWTRRQKDEWWFANVFRGDMPQLTVRSALVGFVLGGLLSATNLYVSAKTGITLGVGLTSVILAFGMFKLLSAMRLAKDFTILENNAMQSIATSAGYMTVPLMSSFAAYFVSGSGTGWFAAVRVSISFCTSLRVAFTADTFSNTMCVRRRFCSTMCLGSRRRFSSAGSVPLSFASL